MYTLLISYDLMGSETYKDYKILIDRIKKYPNWSKPLKSVWLIKTEDTPSKVRDKLRSYIDSDDKLIVVDITNKTWATTRVASNVTEWMHKKM